MLVLGLLAGVAGCASARPAPNDRLVEQSNEQSDDEILFAAARDVFSEQGLDLEIESPDRGMLVSKWTEVNREVRHRYVARVIRSNVGLVLTVDSHYERRELTGAQVQWVDADDAYTLREKQRDEQRMGAAIQARFKALVTG